jgi:hypothetical protein
LHSEARLLELEEERQRKLNDAAALQDAALERRKLQENERLAKLAREEERKNEMLAKAEAERSKTLALKQAKKEEKVHFIFVLKVVRNSLNYFSLNELQR